MPDTGRSEFPRPGSGPPEPSLDVVRRADGFIDALAEGRPVDPQDPADAELAALLGGWRDEMRWPPATGLIAEADAVAALNAGLAEKRPGTDRDRRTATLPRSSRRGLSTVGAAAAAVLCIGGFGAVVAGSGPGDALYGVRNMFFGAPKQVRDDQVGLAAKTELKQVQDLITQGNWEQAQDKLVAVSTQVATIGDAQQKQELLDQFNDLSAKVVERNPQATAPPGVVYTVPPSSAALVPAVEPTSTPGAPPLSTSTTPTTAETASPTTSATTPATTSAASPTPTSESSAAPSSTASTTSPAQQSQPTTTPTSASPTTSAPAPTPTTTAAPASAQQTTAPPVTTTTQAPRAAGTTAAEPPAQTTVSATTPGPAAGADTPAGQTAATQTPEPLPTAALTTTLVPVPAG